MTEQEKRKAELKIVRVLKYWEDADIFSLSTKKRIAEMVIAELEQYFGYEKGFIMKSILINYMEKKC